MSTWHCTQANNSVGSINPTLPIKVGHDWPCVMISLAVAGIHGRHADPVGVAGAADHPVSRDSPQACCSILPGVYQ